MKTIYEQLLDFKKKFPGTVSWRLKAHSKVVEKHLNPEEEVQFVFCAQKNHSSLDLFSTYVIAVTNKRLILAQKRVLFGYIFLSVTPDMFNDLRISSGIIWGKVHIDTVKEVVTLSNLAISALDEIETNITENMMLQKKNYSNNPNNLNSED